MKQIKAFVHRNRVSDLIHALEAAGFRRLSLFDVKGLLRALSAREQEYSVEFGDQVISEMQMELFCEDDDVARAVEIFRRVGRTGRADAGWIYVSPIEQSIPIDNAS
jgi:nitrogen regulatory protein PII